MRLPMAMRPRSKQASPKSAVVWFDTSSDEGRSPTQHMTVYGQPAYWRDIRKDLRLAFLFLIPNFIRMFLR